MSVGALLRGNVCGGQEMAINSMLAGRRGATRESSFLPRTMRSTEGLDRRARFDPTYPPRPRSSRAFVQVDGWIETSRNLKRTLDFNVG